MHEKFQAAKFHGFGVLWKRHTLTHTFIIINEQGYPALPGWVVVLRELQGSWGLKCL